MKEATGASALTEDKRYVEGKSLECGGASVSCRDVTSLCRGPEPCPNDFNFDFGADDRGAGFGETYLGFHQLAREPVDFVGGG
jgi:hypothetical protein